MQALARSAQEAESMEPVYQSSREAWLDGCQLSYTSYFQGTCKSQEGDGREWPKM